MVKRLALRSLAVCRSDMTLASCSLSLTEDVLSPPPSGTTSTPSMGDPSECRRNSIMSATGAKTVLQSFPKSGSFLFDELFSATLDRVFASGNVAQCHFMTFQFGKGGTRDGNVTFQQVERQFADGIDLIGVGVLKQRLTCMATALAQHRLEKMSLSPYSFHGNPPHTMTTRRLHSQHFIDNHVNERFLGHGHVPHQTQQCGSLVQKLSVHQSDALSQQLQQRFPSPPHAPNETPQRRALFHRYPWTSLDDVARVEGSLLETLRNLLSFPSLLYLLFGFFRRRSGETLLLHLVDVRLFPCTSVPPAVPSSNDSVAGVAAAAVVSATRLGMSAE